MINTFGSWLNYELDIELLNIMWIMWKKEENLTV